MDPIQEYYNDLIKRGKFNSNEYSLEDFKGWVRQDPSAIQQLYQSDIKDGLYTEKEYSIKDFTNYLTGSSLNFHQRAFLDTVADKEAKDYNVIVGGGTFDDYSKHPNKIGIFTAYGPSTAAGKYQITKSTWDDVSKKLGLTDFSPESQDKAALYLAQERYKQKTNRSLDDDLQSNDPAYIESIREVLAGKGSDTLWQGLQNDNNFTERFSNHLVGAQGSASDPMSSLLSFDGDVDSSKFNDELIKNLYKNNGGEGEVKSAHIKKHYGIFGKYNDTYDIEVNDNMGKSTHMKFEDIANSSSLESSQNNLIQTAGSFFNGVLGAVSGAGGLLKDVQELVTSGDTSFDKMFDYQDNPLTKYLTDSYNVNVDNNNYSDGYKKLLEQEQIAKEGGDNIGALGNALTKIFYPEYWKENGLETVANSLSFMVPGFGLAKVAGAAVKGAKVLGMGEKATKLVTELGIYSGLKSALEAGAEGAETFKAAYEHGLKTGMSEEEARVMAADYATEVAAVNMPILMASNALEFMGISGKLMSAPGLKRFAYNTIGTALPEGIQEGLQFGIQDNAKRYETEKYDPGKVGLIDNFSGSMGGALDAAYKGLLGANPEFYDSVVMGAVMGGGFAVPGAAKSTYDYYKVEKPIASEVNSVLANSFSDIFQRDENGNFINENGKIKINGTKLQSHLNGLQHERYLNELEDLATAQDNGEAIKLIQGNKISKIIHDSIASGKDVESIKNAIDQAFTPEAYKTNGLKDHYTFEEYKDFRDNAVKFAEESYKETYSNPLLSKQSDNFKENVYYNLSQQKIANHELDKYEGKLNSLPETLSPLQKLEKKDLETKIDALTKFTQNLEEAYNRIFKKAAEDKKQTKEEKLNNTPVEEILNGFEEKIPKGKAAEDLLNEEKKKIVLESLDSFSSEVEYQEAIKQFPEFSKEISENYNGRIEKQKSIQPEIKSAKDLVNRYGEENNLLKEVETKEIFSNFKSRLESKPNLAKEIKQYEILRNNPEHTFKPDPELVFLGKHILAGGTLDSYASMQGLEHNIADPLLQESIDNRSIKKVNPKQKNLEELTIKITDEHQAGTLTKDDAYRYIEEAYDNKQITKTGKDKLNKLIDELFNLPPDPRLKKLMDFGYTEVQAQEFINDGRADTVIANKGKLDVEFEQGPSVITPMFMDTAKGLRADNQYLRQVEVTEPDGKKSLHDITRDELFGDGTTPGLWSSSKRDLLAKRFNVSEDSTFRIVSQPVSIYETNLVETNRILSTAEPGDQFYYETDYKYGNNLEDFGINVVFYSKDGKIVGNKTEGAKRHVAGMVRSLKNPTIDNKVLQDGLKVDERKEITNLRKNLFTGTPTSYPIKLKAVSRKESLNIGKLRPLTAEELRNSFDTVISNWEGTELRFSSNENVLDPVSISGAGKIKQFLPRMAGKIFMFLKSWDINGNQKNIPVELETKKIKEVPRLMESLLEQLKSIEAQTTKEAAEKQNKTIWGSTKDIVKFRSLDSKYDKTNTSEGPKKGMENPRGGVGPVFLFNFETNSRSDRGFYTKIDGKTIKGLTAEQLLERMQEYRVNVPHNPDKIKEFLLENSDVLLTDLDINNTQDNKLIFDNSSIKEIPKTEEKEEIVPKRRGEKVRFKITETKQDPSKDLSFITQRFKDLGIVVSNKELNKLAEIFGANTGTVWGAFHDAVLYLNESSGLKVQRHEAFHILFNVYLNDKQKEEILKEAFDKFGKELNFPKDSYYSDTDITLQLEEKLAEMYEDFSVENLGIVSESFKKAYPIISKIFDEIYKFIYDKYQKLKPYFTNKLSIQDIFYQLEKNTFDKEVFAKRLKSYQKLSSKVARFKIDTLTPVEIKKYARFIATDVLEQMLWNFESEGEDIKYLYLTSMTKSKRNEFINKFLSYGEIDRYVRAHFKELGNPNTGLKIEEALKANRNEFLKYIMQDVNALYDTKYYLEESEEEEKVLLIRETNVNPTENIKGKLKEYLTRIPIRRLINDKYEKEIDEEFGIPKRYDFEQLYNKLLHSLSDNPNINKFWDKIEQLSSQFDWMDTIYTSIKDNMEVNEFDQYYQSELFRLLYAKTGGMRNIDFITESRGKNSVSFHHNGKNTVANKLNDVIADKYETQQINLPELRQIVKTKKLTKNNVHPFLTEFGYEVDQSDALFLFKNSKTNLDYLYNLLSNIEIKDDFNPFQDYRINSAVRSVSRKVAELPSQYTLTVLTVNNENEYVHQANNFLTKFFTRTKEEFDDLATRMESKLIHKGIHLYKGLALGKLATISYDLGIKNKGKAKEYKDYLFADLLSHDLNAYLTEFKSSKGKQIRVPLPTFSDATNRAYLTTTPAKDILTSIVPLVKAEIERIKYCQENITGMKNFDINGKEFILFPFLEEHREALLNSVPELLDKKIKELVTEHLEKGYQQYLKRLVEEDLILREEKKSDNGETYIDYKFTDELHKLDAHEVPEEVVKRYYIQRWYYNSQLIPMLAGDLAFYGNYKSPTSEFSYEKVADDLLKRMKELHSPKEDAIIIDDNNNLKTIRQLVVPDIIVKSLEKELEDYKAINPNTKISNNNITDGQIITSLDFNRQVRDAYGELTEDDKIEYQKIKEGKQGRVTPGFTKPYYYNLEDKDNLLYPLQEKSSEFPLIPAEAFLTKNGEVEFPGEVTDFNKYARPTLAKILWLMNGAGDKTRAFDKVVFQSAIKTDIDLTKLLPIEEIQNLNYDKIYSSIQSHAATEYGRQQIVPTDKHFNNTLKIGSQSRVLITADIQEDIVVTIDGKKRVLTPAEAREVFNSILVANIEENKKEVAAKFADTKSLNDSFKEQAINRNKSVEELKAYEMQADGKPAVPFDYPLTTKENQKLSNAVSKKALISATPGGTFVNRTSIDYADDLEIKRVYDENGKAVGIEYVEVAIPAHNSALALLADKNGVIDFKKLRETYANFDKLLDGFGYRIPTEDKYSMYPIKIKRILPKNVDAAIVLPKEATEITGLDFDVDKMFVLFRAFNIKRGDFSIFTDTVNLYAKQINLLNVDGTNIVYSKEQAKDIFNAMLVNAPANNEAERIIMDYIKDDFEDLKLMIKIEELGYIEPSMDNTLSRHNLMMDIILEITKTPSFAKSFFEGGSSQILQDNINRLDKFGKLNKDIPKGILEPLHQDYNSKKAIVGGNIISIAATHSKHHSTVEGLQGEFGTSYPVNMFDNKSYQDLTRREGEGGRISKLLSSVLFASTEHIKNPLLDALNITTQNVSVFLTGLRLGIPFEHMATLFRYPAVIDLFNSLANISFPSENDFRKHLADKYKITEKKDFDYFKSLAERSVPHSAVENGILKNDPELDKILLSKVLRLFNVSNELESIMSASKMDTEKNFGPTIYDNLFSLKKINDLYKNSPDNRKINGLENVLPDIKIVDGNFKMGSSLLKLNDAYISLLVDQLNSLRKHFGFLSEAFQEVSNVVIDKTGLKVSNFGPKKLEVIHNAIKVATAQSFLKFDYNRVLKINKQFSELKKDKNFKDLCPNLLGTVKTVKLGDQKVIKKITPYKIDKGTTALIKNEWEVLMGDPRYSEFAKELAIYALVTSDFSFNIDSFSQFIPAYSFLTGTEQGMKIRGFFNNMGDMQRFTDIGLDLLSERIILNEPELTKYVDTTNDVDIISSFKVKYGSLFPQVVKVPEIIKLKGNKQQAYLDTKGDPLKYIHTTVYYNYRPTPILYELQDGNYKMVELPSNPAAYSVYTNEAQSFYPLKRPAVPIKETSEEDQRAMVEEGFFNEVETEDGFFIPDKNLVVDISTLNLTNTEVVEEDVVDENGFFVPKKKEVPTNKELVEEEIKNKTARTINFVNIDYVILSDNRIISLVDYKEFSARKDVLEYMIRSAKKMC